MEWFLFKIQGQTVKREEDKVIWKGDSKEVFFVRGLYSMLESNCMIPFPLKIIWNL